MFHGSVPRWLVPIKQLATQSQNHVMTYSLLAQEPDFCHCQRCPGFLMSTISGEITGLSFTVPGLSYWVLTVTDQNNGTAAVMCLQQLTGPTYNILAWAMKKTPFLCCGVTAA
jgi:hypothetical protein